MKGAVAEPHSMELDSKFHQTTFSTLITSSYLELDKNRTISSIILLIVESWRKLLFFDNLI